MNKYNDQWTSLSERFLFVLSVCCIRFSSRYNYYMFMQSENVLQLKLLLPTPAALVDEV